MNLLIDNNDGAGEIDYTQALRTDAPLTLLRERGEWGTCHAGLDLAGAGLPLPQARSHVRVTDDAGAVLFAGYAEADARPVDAFLSTSNAMERVMLHAVESAWLGRAAPPNELQPVSSTQHALALRDVALHVELSPPRADTATDVTVCGNTAAAEYVTELFRGDGSTSSFVLQHEPFRESGDGSLLDESFDEAAFNASVWTRVDVGSYLSLGGGGLRMNGGTGFDGATVLSRTEAVELGGSLIAEASGVMLTTGSDGVLLGFYDGLVTQAQCMAGIRVRGSAGAHSLVAIVRGVEQAASYDFADGHAYTLRVRLHCVEMQRARQRYGVLADGVLQVFGGDAVDAPMRIVLEVSDAGLASTTLPTVLYDGAIAVSPLQAVFAPVNSVALNGSVARVTLSQTGSCLVTTTATDGTTKTQRQGSPLTGAGYALASSGTVSFASGLLPQPGELVTVQYRRGRRSVSRWTDSMAEFVKSSLGLPGVPAWSGRVVSPAPRSSQDCEAAAKALVALGAGSATSVAGTVSWTRGAALRGDVLPGDMLRLSSAEAVQTLPVTAVNAVDGNCKPECVTYTASFRQSRADSMDFHVERGMASDVAPPVAVASDVALPLSLQGLQVTVATETALEVDSGVDAPDGCGFEVRRSDANFGASGMADLVLRSAVRSFSIPRSSFTERFFVRMYDNASPPRYSSVSSVVVTSLAVS